MRRTPRIALCLVALATIASCRSGPPPPPPPLARVVTIADIADPFGVAAAPDGAVYATDGNAGRVVRVDPATGAVTTVAEGLDMPSAVAVAPDGTLVVANTGASTIARVDPTTHAVTTVAGAPGRRGNADGPAASALFDGPVGVAVAKDGTVFVADTYNDRVRAIAPDGAVRTVAGGARGNADGAAADARFDTPCGVAVAADGALFVADTANRAIRRVAPDGAVTTVVAEDVDEPLAVVARDDGSLLVADASGSCVRAVEGGAARRFAGADFAGRQDGPLASARLNRPTGVAVAPDGTVAIADSVNGAVRLVVSQDDVRVRTDPAPYTTVDARALAAKFAARWPYEPPDRPREIAATIGEVRTEGVDSDQIWFHNAIDIPGAAGETVYAVTTERVTRPVAAWGAGQRSEVLRLSDVAYIHVKIGRDAADKPLPGWPCELLYGDDGKLARVRVRRGATISVGDRIGVLNPFNHVHLTVGPPGCERNALGVVALPGFADTTAPTIEAVSVLADDGSPNGAPLGGVDATAKRPSPSPVTVSGRVRVVVRAWDRNDRNADRRRLGLYRLGYEVLDRSGARVAGDDAPTIAFDRLPADPRGVRVAYAPGSRAWFSGPTIFLYEVTNLVRDGDSREGRLDLSRLAPGDYVLRAWAEDASGNRATREVALAVTSPPAP